MDKRLLEALISRFEGGPVGISSLAVAVGEDSGTIEEVNEPYLIRKVISSALPKVEWPYLKRTRNWA